MLLSGYIVSVQQLCLIEGMCVVAIVYASLYCPDVKVIHHIYIFVCFTACPSNKFGKACVGTCNCNATNAANAAQTCNAATGVCVCNQYWMGTTCDTDIDECTAGTHTCTADSTCANRVNGYDCPCDRGFILNSGACAGIMFRVFFVL